MFASVVGVDRADIAPVMVSGHTAGATTEAIGDDDQLMRFGDDVVTKSCR